MQMLSVEEALELVGGAVRPLSAHAVSLRGASGRFLAQRIVATHNSPPFDTSAMDGFAVRAVDIAGASPVNPVILPVQGEAIAGDGRSVELPRGLTHRINTGAVLPAGATAVVRIEDVGVEGDSVIFTGAVPEGSNLRRQGEDFRAGSPILDPGRRLDALAIGLLASLGLADIQVSRLPRVALLSTGDELLEPGEPLLPGSIYNSSRFALPPLLSGFGAEVHDLGRIQDTPEATRESLARALDFDVVVTTGGVSMGTHDFVRPAFMELGVEEVFWKVRQRPGKPLFFGIRGDTLCFGLPGNPVSVFVTALIYVRHALLGLQGARELNLQWKPGIAAEAFEKKPGLTVFARASRRAEDDLSGLPALTPSPSQGSHQFSGLAVSDGLVRLEEEAGTVLPGERLDFLDLRSLL